MKCQANKELGNFMSSDMANDLSSNGQLLRVLEYQIDSF